MKKEIKRISLMTAIFLTVALASSAVEAGVIRINGTFAGSESWRTFSRSSGRVLCQWELSRQADTHAWSIHSCFIRLVVDFAFLGTPPGAPGASQLVVGDAANGDSILTCFFGNNAGDFMRQRRSSRCGQLDTIIGGTGPVRWC